MNRESTRKRWLTETRAAFVAGILLVVLLLSIPLRGAEPLALGGASQPFPGRIPAPSLDGGKEWLNAGGEITLKDLRGKIVVLDFWTYCCINCMHILPDLKYLEKKYNRELVVIGVHSAKFDNEKESGNIRRAIQRYEIEHPVINDADTTIWQKYGVRSWPTVVVIDPEGFAVAAIPGEGRRAILERVIDRLVAYHRARGTLDRSPVHFELERKRLPLTPLRFPGKVLADAEGKRLFISDSNHNRIVVASRDGKLIDVIGSGTIGHKNGSYAEASFDHPQGLALVGDKLYVADTENHLIREINLGTKRVQTIAGTGKQAQTHGRGGPSLQTDLNSPWDLVHFKDRLYVAMAGSHQIWKVDFKRSRTVPYAGNGDEDIVDGPTGQSSLAQPSGLVSDGEYLYVVDSEGSSVRRIALDHNPPETTTIVGTSQLPVNRLFTFGDRDGTGAEVRLQHPLGIALYDGKLLIADTYNHKIKTVDIEKKTATTLLGDRQSGDRLDPVRFFEPGGLSVAGDELFVADTNNHRVVRVDLKSLKASDFVIAGLQPPAPPDEEQPDVTAGKVTTLSRQRVAAENQLMLNVVLRVPKGFKLNRQFPVSCRASGMKQKLIDPNWLNKRHKLALPDETVTGEAADTVTISVPLIAASGEGDFQLSVSYGYCREGEGGLCKLQTAMWSIPLQIASDGKAGAIRLEAPLPMEVSKSPE